ncbi:hypothetical protein OC25_07150 [Pedobacter kyungheensis]|uniref:Glycosyltransferase 2-like domain-containing protein n=1 Tax=Pedobacter kyungheensis TaxID=1069985 RepID=A0A0C1FTK2_9SPHI|nr:glycosyltransferase family 2 protein [Pedobacter kyungheensis]KIA95108.1 hypothetical protein OC25_07150 [Pedobacter kyungheensis]
MIKQDLVTVIIPFYNASIYLNKCVESVIAQTWPEIEIILVDDGSTDGSLALASAYRAENIRLFSLKKGGAARARNKGMLEAKGSYIQFLDADDFISADKIEQQVLAAAQNPGKLMVCSTIHFQKEDQLPTLLPSAYEERFIKSTDDPVYFLTRLWGGLDNKGAMVQPNTWLTPKKIIDKAGFWNENLTLDDDGEFFSRVVLQSKGIVKTEGYNYYRKSTGAKNLSASQTKSAYQSLLESALSKKEQLLSRTDSHDANFAIYRLLHNVAVLSYPNYPTISAKALAELPPIDRKFSADVGGGKLAKTLNYILGWKFTRKLMAFKTKLA